MERRTIVILGPTASGKSQVAIKLATKLKSEIISADSRQFYKGLNIGTAKVTGQERSLVKHHFIDSLNLTDYYNASRYEFEATKTIDELNALDKIPIVVGGSGLYIRALVDGILEEVEIDESYRTELMKLRELKGDAELYRMLEKIDPKAAATMLPQNWKRIIRALEVYKLSGKSIIDLHEQQQKQTTAEFLQFGIDWPRDLLYDRINKRVDLMIEAGLVEETKEILDSGYDSKLNSLNTVGYKEVIEYLNGVISLNRAIELIKRNSRRYAKRQLTWFRKDARINWIVVKSLSELEAVSEIIFNRLNIH